ncbi:hypothetical protein [Limosilactobacillus reuteri]|uniref:hypothetical protein n=1 Tax=Limosilactobacillus reuteri TaxID=1598 RepID=UPI00128D44BE|nr:hypothetical protein [Limosilactobacillus reuteri]MCC4482775.1 hypothetical protein [Limosilactobacillus reuteri]MCU4691878.1 hypothetical protein [Limosilactobacillus reuteri]MQB63674.1 hypothetical protein [Limosilactobacillus reuteri]MQB68060.1 hypothetical protein [Limosilactobacillus reuteri]MQB94097.1 hypothetical protein [Limosilactobacillus reuteri]
MSTNLKRNMIQVRLSDKEFEQFEAIKESLKKKNNAATLREMIQLAPFVGKKTQAYVEKLSKVYNDLDAKADALIWNSSNVTKNLNEIAHAANIAKNNDPANETTWNWIIQQLQQIFPTINQLNQVGSETKEFIKKELDKDGSD